MKEIYDALLKIENKGIYCRMWKTRFYYLRKTSNYEKV